jgi:uncharacterized protein YfaT (DUF1175 family)
MNDSSGAQACATQPWPRASSGQVSGLFSSQSVSQSVSQLRTDPTTRFQLHSKHSLVGLVRPSHQATLDLDDGWLSRHEGVHIAAALTSLASTACAVVLGNTGACRCEVGRNAGKAEQVYGQSGADGAGGSKQA